MDSSDLYGAFYRDVLFPSWEHIRGRSPVALRQRLEDSQWLPLEVLRRHQTRALRDLLDHAHRYIPFYRDRMDRAGLVPQDINRVEDIAGLPLLSRDELRESVTARMSTVHPRPVIRKMTSGSTGQPVIVDYDVGSEAWRQAVKLRSYAWAGYEVGDRVVHYWGRPPCAPAPVATRMKIWLDRSLRRELYIDCIDQSEAALEDAVQKIAHFRPAVIVAYARAAANLARHVNARGCRPWRSIPLIATAEQLLPEDRAALEEAFGPRVFNSYGGRETMLLAMECPAHSGLHVPMENILVELVVTGAAGRSRPARPGEVGEVVVTDLHNFGAPLIRYVNGDLARAAEPGACACGRSLMRIQGIEGRSADTLTDARGDRVQGMVFPLLLLPYAHAVRHYQAVQHVDRSVTFRFVPGDGHDASTARAIHDAIRRALKGVPVHLQAMSEIPAAASGKRRPVIVERRADAVAA